MTYQEIKLKNEQNVNAIMESQKVFWAFSNEQLEKGKQSINITDNKELTSIGMGGFLPKANADNLFILLEEENKRYKQELKEAKEAKEKAIAYELSNHECYYTGDISPVIELFAGLYTKDDIKQVFNKLNQS